jgi:glycosyltransferase involved in cell wall biosynthesis
MTAPLVSVLTPSLNQSRWLKDNICSVSRQTYSHMEHIIMDGASTDGSLDILERAGNNVRWVSEPDRGQSHALNKAFGSSRGEIIGWLNADDAYYDVHVVQAAVKTFEANPDVDIVYGHAALVNAEGLILHMIWVPPFSRYLLCRHNFIIQPATFIRRAVLSERLVDESFDFAMDRELWLRLSEHLRFMRINRVLAVDRHHPGRKVFTRREVGLLEGRRLNDRYQIPDTRRARALLGCSKMTFRILGVRLAPTVRTEWAFPARVDGLTRLWNRQLLRRRAAMPLGMS